MKKLISALLCILISIPTAITVNSAAENTIKSECSDLYQAFCNHCNYSDDTALLGKHTIAKNFEIIQSVGQAKTDDEISKAYSILKHQICNQNISPEYVYLTYRNSLNEKNFDNWYQKGDWDNFVSKREQLGKLIDKYYNSGETDYSSEAESCLSDGFYEMLYAYNTMCSRYQQLGDVNGDRTTDINDVTLIQKYLVKLSNMTTAQKMLCATNYNYETISISDATNIQKKIVGINQRKFTDNVFVCDNGFCETYDRRMSHTFNFNICPRTFGKLTTKLDNNYYDTNYLETDYYKKHSKSITYIDDMENHITQIPPDYWVNAIDNAGSKIIDNPNIADNNAFRFIWISDIHGINGYKNTDNNAGKSKTTDIGKVAQYAAVKYNIPFVAISGDIMSQASHTNEEDVYKEYEAMRGVLSPIESSKLLITMGNHDGAWGAPENGRYYLKNIGNKNVYKEIYQGQSDDKRRVSDENGTYYYVDSIQKIRFIMLNSQTDGDGSIDENGHAMYNSMYYSVYGTKQLKWLAETALDMPEGYTAIIMAHKPLSKSKDGHLLAGIIDAYNKRTTFSGITYTTNTYWGLTAEDKTYNSVSADVDFSNAKGEIAAFFHGHIHEDTVDTTSYSFPTISITTAGADVRDDNPENRVPDTTTETAMDIVTIDRQNRTIHTTRLGIGTDRVIPY